MNCRTVQARLTAFLDGELSAVVAGRVQGHLDTCTACAQVWQEERALRQIADAWTVEGGEVWEAVRQEAEAESLAEIRDEMRRLRTEVQTLQAEVAALRAQVAVRQPEGLRRPSPMLPYPQSASSSRILM